MIANLICRQSEYDGVDEMWVTIKETGEKIESTTYEELHQQEREARRMHSFFQNPMCHIHTQ